MIPILSGNVASALPTGYEVANSCKWNKADDAYLTNTSYTGAGSQTKWTFSCWYKKCADVASGNAHALFSQGVSGTYFDTLFINASEKLAFVSEKSGSTNLASTMVFQDYNAWYHIVCAVDTTQGTAANRVKMYVNGSQITLSTTTYPAEDQTTWTGGASNGDYPLKVGSYPYGGVYSPEGYLAEVVMINNQQLTPTSFGEFDEDSPTIWKPKDVSTLTPGTNGFYLDFEDSSNLGNDIFGNGDFANTNLAATDQCVDSPTNNFSTMNPLDRGDINSAMTFSEGNLKTTAGSGSTSWTTRYAFSSIGVTAGKWWVEAKCVDSGASNQFYIGVLKDKETETWNSSLGGVSGGWGYYSNDGSIYYLGSHTGGTTVTYTDGDFIGMALDVTNGTLQFYKNGSASGNQVTSLSTTSTWWFAHNGYAAIDAEWNFGNPPYSISSGNADDNGYGNFEHAPPSGFLALCTKNLGSDGG